MRTLVREYRAVVEEILELRGADDRIRAWLRAITEPGMLADSCGYSPDLTYEQRLQLLRTLDVPERLELALTLQRERLAELQIRKRIRDDVQGGRREAAARLLPAPADGSDPQGARRGRRVRR